MQKKIDFHRRDTEDTEDIGFLICREIPANQNHQSAPGGQGVFAFKVNRININEHIPFWEPSRRDSIFYPIPQKAGLDKKDNKLSGLCDSAVNY